MLHKREVSVPATTKTVTYKVTCDFCGQPVQPERCVVKKATLQFEDGTSYPEGGSGERTIFDCCSNCWEAKVKPALVNLGAESRTEEWDY